LARLPTIKTKKPSADRLRLLVNSAPRIVRAQLLLKHMEDYSIERGGISNLDFTGELIGQSGGPNPRVKIYRTKDLKYIGELKADQKLAQAQHFDKPVDVINWFKTLNYGSVSPEVQDTIEDATKHDDGFKVIWNEHVD
jgi:hypothetical protein